MQYRVSLVLVSWLASFTRGQRRTNVSDGVINDSMPLFGPPQPPPLTTIYKNQNQGLQSDRDRLGLDAANRAGVEPVPWAAGNYPLTDGQGGIVAGTGGFGGAGPFAAFQGGGGLGAPTNVDPFGGGGGMYMNGAPMVSDPYGNLDNLGRPNLGATYGNMYAGQANAGMGSNFYCFHCASPRKHGKPEMLAAMDQLFNLRFSSYPYDAVNEYCDRPVDYQSIRKQACRHPYCYTIKFGDPGRGDLMLTVRGCAENFMAINAAQLNNQMGTAGTCRPLPSNHHLAVKECVCRAPLCDDYSRGTGASVRGQRTLISTFMLLLIVLRINYN